MSNARLDHLNCSLLHIETSATFIISHQTELLRARAAGVLD
jgi:hypothetical protein